ncbi:recombinase RecT [Enterococcus saccharolyticus]|uniref:recombinase RecT n=1 Tax=Enterococcus saccharolyticus TaxID=41997 RepID=UPI001E3132AC|nr:RecT family recombinase [Enterococcus saccharolyticus]MCD5001211.1 recombinase RecT [Enterococcus saccharolyticus]
MTNQTPAVLQKDITDTVNHKVAAMQQDGLALPQNYSPANALKSAFFAMTNAPGGNLLEKCSKESIANSLLDMVVQGLSPAKTQCYFVPYGQTLKMTRSYFGTQAVLKRLKAVKDVWANVIYEGDEFEIEIINGRETLKNHKTSFGNRDNQIIGVYCIIEKEDGEQVLTTMTKKEIDAAWSQAKTKNVQSKFPQEMAKRTVINRAAKAFVNTSDDSDLLIDAINNTTANEYQDANERKEAEIVEEIKENANSEVLDPQPTQPAESSARPDNVTDDGEIIDGDFSEPGQTDLGIDESSDPY